MLKTMVGYSKNHDDYKCGVESCEMIKDDIKSSKINMLFTSCDNKVADVIAGVKSQSDAPVIGCSSSGRIIVPDGIITGESFAGVFGISDPDLVVGVAASEAGRNARDIGRRVAIEAVEDAKTTRAPAYFYMVASPKEEEEYLAGIQDVIGRVPFFGGSAADNTVEGKWKIFCNDKVFSDGVAVAFFYTDNEIVTEYTGAFRETNCAGIITEVDNNRKLVKIDGVPAIEKYKEWTGARDADLKGSNLLAYSVLHPLGVKDPTGQVTLIRHPMNGNEDNSISVGNKLVKNTACVLLEATVDELIDATGDLLKEVNEKMYVDPSGYFLVHCGGRSISIGDRLDEVHKQLVKQSKGLPFICIFTFGEYGYSNHSANSCGGLMLSFTGFGRN